MKRYWLVLALAPAALLPAQQAPQVENGRVDSRPAGSLESTVKTFTAAQSSAAWIGYEVPVIPGDHRMCGWENGREMTRRVSLEGPRSMYILLRVEHNEIGKLRVSSPDCLLDAGGLTLTWLTGVNPGESVRFLRGLAVAQERRSDPAMMAISLHDTPSAIPTLIEIAHDNTSPSRRGKALFWLAQKAGNKLAAETIAGAVDNDPDTDVKKKAVFALSQLPSGEGVPKLIDVARTNRNPQVRKQALFWLGQSKDPRALKFIEDILTR